MDRIKRVELPEKVASRIIRLGGNAKMVQYLLSYNMINITSFSYLADVPPSSLTYMIKKGKLELAYPFPIMRYNKALPESGPKYIRMDEKALNYLQSKKMKSHVHKHSQFNPREFQSKWKRVKRKRRRRKKTI